MNLADIYPLYLRQAIADQNMAPQADNGTVRAAIKRFIALDNPEFVYFQHIEDQ